MDNNAHDREINRAYDRLNATEADLAEALSRVAEIRERLKRETRQLTDLRRRAKIERSA